MKGDNVNCKEYSKEEYGEIHRDEADRKPSICYSYEKGVCSEFTGYNSDYICKSYIIEPGYQYTCPGHRNYLENSDIDVETYSSESIIDSLQIKKIQNAIQNEFAARNEHKMYMGKFRDDVPFTSTGNVIETNTPNIMDNRILNLKQIIINQNDYDQYPSKEYV